jgi:hypothetical protein
MRDSWLEICAGLIILIIIVVLCGIPGCIQANKQDVVTITVESKDIKTYDKNSKYLVWSKENEVFEITDSMWVGRFNSSDFYGRIEVGKTYKVKVIGYRVPFLSWYRNIIEIID